MVVMLKIEAFVLSVGKYNGAWDDPDAKAFKLCNPLLLKTYRPEKKCDSEHYRIFSSVMGGFKAGIADVQAKCSGKNNRLNAENTLKDLFSIYGFSNESTTRKLVLFLRRSLSDESISLATPIGWLLETMEAPVQEN